MSDELLKQIVDKLDGLKQELSDFRTETNGKIDAIQKQLDRHDTKLNAITEQVVKNSEDISQIKADQHALVIGQAKQDKILEALAMRSLEQETDIKDLKRVN